MDASKTPRVSIGMPVYNGERYLAEAVDSVLAQTFRDFDLLICDNASTDRTGEIAQAYAARDPRVRYVRNPQNIGCGPNFNRVFELSAPLEFFKWMSHDDTISPTYLEKCVAALDADPGAILCHPLISIIDDDGRELYVYDSKLDQTADLPSVRFRDAIMLPHRNLECYGVIRRWAVRRSGLMRGFYLDDRSIVVDFSLMGRFIHLREPLFQNREHKARATNAVTRHEWHRHMDSRGPRIQRLAHLLLYVHYVRSVNRYVSDRGERLRCYGHLLRWWGDPQNRMIFMSDMLGFLVPSLFPTLRRMVKSDTARRLKTMLGGTVGRERKV
jgi:glycosyltransferase involved in cell wall biosynthesis